MTPKMTTTVKLIMAAALPFALWWAFMSQASVSIGIQNVFRVTYLPVAGWLCAVLYGLAWSRLFSLNISRTMSLAALMTAPAHITILLYKLNAQLMAGGDISRVYIIYIGAITAFVMGSMLLWSGRLVKAAVLKRDDKSLFLLPIVLVTLAVLLLYFRSFKLFAFIPVVLAGSFALITVCCRDKAIAVMGMAKKIVKTDGSFIVLLFLLALLVRLAFSAQILTATGGGEVFVSASDDGDTYDTAAWSIARDPAKAMTGGRIFPLIFDPGYVLFLAAVYKAFGHNFYALTFVQSAVNAMVPVFIFLTARLLFSRRVAVLAAFFACVDQALVMYSVVIGTEALFLFFLSAVLLLFLYRIKGQGSGPSLWAAGICLGLAVITRSMLILLPLFMYMVWMLADKSTRLRVKTTGSVVLCAGMLVAILPVTAMNYINVKKFHLIARSNNRLAICWGSDIKGMEGITPSNKKFIEMGIDPFNDPKGSIKAVLRSPGKFAKAGLEIWPKRVMNFFFWPNFGYCDPVVLVNPSRLPNEFGSAAELYIAILSFIGAWALIRRVPVQRHTLVIVMIIMYFLLVHVLLYRVNTVRYRVAVIPYVWVVTCLGLERAAHFISKNVKN